MLKMTFFWLLLPGKFEQKTQKSISFKNQWRLKNIKKAMVVKNIIAEDMAFTKSIFEQFWRSYCKQTIFVVFHFLKFLPICIYIKMKHKSALLFWKFQKKVFVNRSSVHCSRGMEVKEETKGNSSVQRYTGTTENQEINNNQINNQIKRNYWSNNPMVGRIRGGWGHPPLCRARRLWHAGERGGRLVRCRVWMFSKWHKS